MRSVEDEVKRVASHLRLWIARKRLKLGDVEGRLGWSPGHISKFISGWSKMKVEDLFLVLVSIDVDPADFLHDCYPRSSSSEFPFPLITDLRRSGARTLPEAMEQFQAHEPISLAAGNLATQYIDRLNERIGALLAVRALRKPRNVLLVAGQPNCGKSTMILAALASEAAYTPVVVDLYQFSDPSPFDILVLMAAALAEILEVYDKGHDPLLQEATRMLIAEGEVTIPPRARMKMSGRLKRLASSGLRSRAHLNCAKWLVDALCHAMARKCKLSPVIVVSNLSYVAADPAALVAGLETAGVPAVPILIELPLSAAYDSTLPRFESIIVPNVPISAHFSGDRLADAGTRFMGSIIDRYISREMIAADARQMLVRMSGGSVGDLLQAMEEAASQALEASARVIEVELVWPMVERKTAILAERLTEEDLRALAVLSRNPFEEVDPPVFRRLLDLNALIPQATENSVWFAVHPIAREVMAKVETRPSDRGADPWYS